MLVLQVEVQFGGHPGWDVAEQAGCHTAGLAVAEAAVHCSRDTERTAEGLGEAEDVAEQQVPGPAQVRLLLCRRSRALRHCTC